MLQDYARQNRFRVVQSFEDAETAKTTGRRQFACMVQFFKRNPLCRVLLVEKTDRVSRNFRDAVTLEDLDITIHFVKEGQVLSKESSSQAILVYGFNLVLARHYSNNLREEVKKGMREKAAQGVFPGYAPFGYRNNRAERTIEIDPEDAAIVQRIFTLYASGSYSLTEISRRLRSETGKRIGHSALHWILRNRFYSGLFEWGGQVYQGTHPLFIDPLCFDRAQRVLAAHHRPTYLKREIAFRRLMRCAYDGCALTGEIQKEKYVYYRCTENRGKCRLPRFREQEIVQRLGEPLRSLQVSEKFRRRLVSALVEDGLAHCVSHAESICGVANSAYSLYRSHSDLREKAKLLKMVFADCFVDEAGVKPIYRKPFELAHRAASLEEWREYFSGEVCSYVWPSVYAGTHPYPDAYAE